MKHIEKVHNEEYKEEPQNKNLSKLLNRQSLAFQSPNISIFLMLIVKQLELKKKKNLLSYLQQDVIIFTRPDSVIINTIITKYDIIQIL